MRSVIFYNPAVLAAGEGEDNARTLDDIRATAEAIRQSGGTCVLRDASVFGGDLERVNDAAPDAVLLLGPDFDKFDDIRQAFEAVDVSVEETDFLEPQPQSEAQGSSEDSELAVLKARATELGIHFAPNIGYDTLKGRVEAKEAELDEESEEDPDHLTPDEKETKDGEDADTENDD